ncbi:MAG: CPBP family intramembrane metalloprotease [Caldiserica bacterium]|nr:CPBP family intramembrane metalloprotease [Caldisericota bacterium]
MLVVSDLVMISPVLIFGLNGNGFTWESVGLKPIVINWKRIGQIAIIAISLVLFEILAMLVLEHLKVGIPRFSRLSPLETIVSNNFFLFMIFVFFLAILVPIIEEIYFRGFVYGWLRKYFRPWVGILVSALIFGFLHYKSWFTMVFAFMFGVTAAYLYERDKTLVSPIALHICVNIMAYFINFYIPGI